MKELPPELQAIHESFVSGRLQIVVGAGASIAAGLPGWNDLNASMINEFFRGEFENSGPGPFPLEPEELGTLSKVFESRFGRDAVIDLLRQRLDARGEESSFINVLYKALYGDMESYDLQPIHRELAAAMGQRAEADRAAYIYTLNYDDALETAIENVRGEPPEVVTTEGVIGDNAVVHLHGYLPIGNSDAEPADLVEGEIILSEKDYLSSMGQTADQRLSELFEDDDSDVLLLGMSLEDPRLRRLLHRRASAGIDQDNEVWVLLSEGESHDGGDATMRKSHRFADYYVADYWKAWGVHAISVSDHEFVPACLRAIRLGTHTGSWVSRGAEFLDEQDVYEEIYSTNRQAKQQIYLMQQYDTIRRKFEVAADEEFILSFFIPNRERQGEVQPAFVFAADRREHRRSEDWDEYPYDPSLGLSPRSNFVVDRVGKDKVDKFVDVHILSEDHAESRNLDVSSWTTAQGATGFAMVSGTVLDVRENAWFFRQFDEQKREIWEEDQVYSSLLSLPIYDSKEWIPIGAACIASIFKEPFWEVLTDDERANLEHLMRAIFRNVIAYKSVF